MEIGRIQNLHFWSNFDPPFFPKDGGNPKILAVVRKKVQPLGYSNVSKSRLYLLSFLGKIRLLFALFGLFLAENKAGSPVIGSE